MYGCVLSKGGVLSSVLYGKWLRLKREMSKTSISLLNPAFSKTVAISKGRESERSRFN